MADLTSASATALAAAIREKRVSALEVIDAHLDRIEAVNPKLNAVVQLTADAARAEARKADETLAGGDAPGPLHGVPFTVKDWIETEGVVCAAGYEERASYIPKRDATVVARMRAAGAILLGKTNVTVTNPVYGRTNNPYDTLRTPGGSSSGEAAIIAAGGSPLGLGSDSGGSIRAPAALCGVAGLKPTTGRVPNTGHFPQLGSLSDPRTTIGPLARAVEDLALALPVIAGVDWRDDGVIPMRLGDYTEVDLASLRVAWFTAFEGATPTDEVEAVVRAAVTALGGTCHEVTEDQPPRIEESLATTQAYWRRTRSYLWREWATRATGPMPGEEIERSIFAWERLRRSFIAFMERYDVIVCPATPSPAGTHADADANPVESFLFTLPYSLTGWPAAVVRGGTSSDGMPIAVQVVARPWRDDVAIRLAQHVEAALGGWEAPRI